MPRVKGLENIFVARKKGRFVLVKVFHDVQVYDGMARKAPVTADKCLHASGRLARPLPQQRFR
jgi:hypothetical protein